MNVATEKQVQIIRPLAEYSANARIQICESPFLF